MTPSIDHVTLDKAVFERIFLYLILSDYLPITEVEHLHKCSESFDHFHIMILRMEPDLIYEFFQNDPDYAPQATIPIERRSKFLLLSAIHQFFVL